MSVKAARSGPRKRRVRGGRVGFASLIERVTVATHVPLVLVYGEIARRLGVPWPFLVGALLAVAAALPTRSRARAIWTDWRRGAWRRLVDEVYYVHWCAAFGAALPVALVTVVGLAIGVARGGPVALPGGAILVTYAAVLATSFYGIVVRRRWVVTRRVGVRVEGLSRAFDGYRIVQLSDLHIGGLTPKETGAGWVARANAEKADMVVVTGDLVTSGTEFYPDVAEVLGGLRARDGVFVSMGNHDYFGDGEPLIEMMRARGLRVLRNESVDVARGGETLRLAAIDDTWTRRDDIERALAGARGPTVLLAHDPSIFAKAASLGVDLVLSGHTHGGQVAVPFVARWLNLARLSYKYTYGLYRLERSALFVHAGLGVTGPPIRLGVPPEVAVVTLACGPKGDALAG